MSVVSDTQTAQTYKRAADDQFEQPDDDVVRTTHSSEPLCATVETCYH